MSLHLRYTALHKKILQWWPAVQNTITNLTDPRIKPLPKLLFSTGFCVEATQHQKQAERMIKSFVSGTASFSNFAFEKALVTCTLDTLNVMFM